MINIDDLKVFINQASINDVRKLNELNDKAWQACMNYSTSTQIECCESLEKHVVEMAEKHNKALELYKKNWG